MKAEVDENGNWFVFPSIIERDGKLIKLSPEEATNLALEGGGEAIFFGKNKEAAISFSKDGYKLAAGWKEADIIKNK